MKSLGSQKKTMRHCSKHGDYEVQEINLPFGIGEFAQGCPECRKEMEQEEKRILENQRQEAINNRLAVSGIPKRYLKSTLANYNTKNQGQRNALRVAKYYLKQLEAGSDCSLILFGLPGTGKTHLGCALAQEYLNNSKDRLLKIKYTSAYRATAEVKSCFSRDSQKTEWEVIKEYQNFDLVVLDEVGVQFESNAEKMIFFQIINGRYEEMKPTILISNLTKPELIEFIGDRCFDRLSGGGGAVIPFNWESYRQGKETKQCEEKRPLQVVRGE